MPERRTDSFARRVTKAEGLRIGVLADSFSNVDKTCCLRCGGIFERKSVASASKSNCSAVSSGAAPKSSSNSPPWVCMEPPIGEGPRFKPSSASACLANLVASPEGLRTWSACASNLSKISCIFSGGNLRRKSLASASRPWSSGISGSSSPGGNWLGTSGSVSEASWGFFAAPFGLGRSKSGIGGALEMPALRISFTMRVTRAEGLRTESHSACNLCRTSCCC
mmetsp:Transcript_31511/g.57263  ORF Transcript_31511/g.57263 Transcript_31511/m.57263 type:complete len:223 (+) Transcript_31511:611-1279(+)